MEEHTARYDAMADFYESVTGERLGDPATEIPRNNRIPLRARAELD